MNIAYNAQMGQFDKAGTPYIYHPIHVAEQMNDEVTCIAALLHDVVEDTDITFEDLEKDFPKEVIDVLKLLTHDKNIDYMDYIRKIKTNELAVKVKIADIKHNMDKSRLDGVDEKSLIREEKYKKALEILDNC